MVFGKGKSPKIKVKEDMNKDLCKKLDGEVLELSDGSSACVFSRDPESGEPVKINLENITPDIRDKVENQTGKEIARG